MKIGSGLKNMERDVELKIHKLLTQVKQLQERDNNNDKENNS